MDILETELEFTRAQLKEYSRHIAIARIIMFILLGLLWVCYGIGLCIALSRGGKFYGNKDAVQLLGVSLLLALNFYSYKSPFLPLLVFTAFVSLGSALYIYIGMLKLFSDAISTTGSSAANIFLFIAGLSVQVAFSFFMVRGTISAKRYEKLKKLVENQTGAV